MFFSTSTSPLVAEVEEVDVDRLVDQEINAAIVLAASTFAITKLLTIDRDYWHVRKILQNVVIFLPSYAASIKWARGRSVASSLLECKGWTLFEILRYAPQHSWSSYEDALKTNPVVAKMMTSGIVYSLGDWIAQSVMKGNHFSNLIGLVCSDLALSASLHGSLSHYYYHLWEALFPFQDWWVVPAKVLFDQTVCAAVWNSIYYVLLGFLRFESPASIISELKSTFWSLLTAGWKLWPFAHLITYGGTPVEQRLLWVDCVELVWVTILSTYSNEKSEARSSEALSERNTESPSIDPKE